MPSSDDSAEPNSQESDFVTTFEPDTGEKASETIVDAIAALTNVPAHELTPLYESVDPDALDALVSHAQSTADSTDHEVWFSYEEFDVGVRSDGEVRVRTATDAASSA